MHSSLRAIYNTCGDHLVGQAGPVPRAYLMACSKARVLGLSETMSHCQAGSQADLARAGPTGSAESRVRPPAMSAAAPVAALAAATTAGGVAAMCRVVAM